MDIYHNNLVLTPVRAVQVNALIDKINKGLCRPVTYTYYVGGYMSSKIDGTYIYLGFIPLATKLNPTIFYEIVSRGRIPQDDGVLFANRDPPSVGTIRPFCVLHGVANPTPGCNDSEGYNSQNLNPRMSIYPGSCLVERPQFTQPCVNAVNALSSGDPWHLDVGVQFVQDSYNTRPDAGTYKDDFVVPQVIWPSFQLNVTVCYEQGVTL